MTRRRRVWAVAGIGLLAATLCAPTVQGAPSPSTASILPNRPLALGSPGLSESRTVQQLGPGVRLTQIVRGEASDDEYWTINVKVDFQLLGDRSAAADIAAQVKAAGLTPRIDQIDNPKYHDQPNGTLGWRVRVGEYPSSDAAQDDVATLKAADLSPTVDWTGDDGAPITGPWRIDVVTVDRNRVGDVRATYGTAINGREKTSDMSAADGALAAINAGFFATTAKDGFPGEPSGLGVYAGHLRSEAANGRTALVLNGNRARLTPVSSALSVRSDDGARREVDGVDRKPGIIHLCGGVGGDEPTEQPRHAGPNCTDPSELILNDNALGADVDAEQPAVEAVLDDKGRVGEVREPGGAVPDNGKVLLGTGDAADWLREHAKVGQRLRFGTRLTDAAGNTVPLTQRSHLVGGGPMLIKNGRTFINARAEGDSVDDTPSFVYSFGMRRNPRTMVGVDAAGRLLLVTVDGRQPGYSVGTSFTEQARLMQSLGAVSAMNLDGGGSTATVVHGKIINSPSDAAGERAVGDALEVLPCGCNG